MLQQYKDTNKNEVILKIVNTSKETQEIEINLNGKKLDSKGIAIILKSENLEDENSFDNPKNIYPTKEIVQLKKGQIIYGFEPYTVTILKLNNVYLSFYVLKTIILE